MNDYISNELPADVQEQTFVTIQDAEGNEVRLPVQGEVTVVQDTEFSADPAGN